MPKKTVTPTTFPVCGILFSLFIHPKTGEPFAEVSDWSKEGKVRVLVPRMHRPDEAATYDRTVYYDANLWTLATRDTRTKKYSKSNRAKFRPDEYGCYFLIDLLQEGGKA